MFRATPHVSRDSRQPWPRFHGRIAALLLFAVTLVACGTQFLYNRAGWLATTYVRNQVSLDDAQIDALRVDVDAFFRWHRTNELPRYVEFLKKMSRDVLGPLSAQSIDAARTSVEQFVRDAAAQLAPGAARWAATLSPAQFDEFLVSLGEDDSDLREEYCDDPEKRAKRRVREVTKAIEDWTGRLSKEQRALIRARLDTLAPTGCAWVDARIRSRVAFRELVEQHRSSTDYVARVAGFLTDPESRWPPGYREPYERNRNTIVAMLADLHAMLTTEQRSRIANELADYAQDFRELARQPVVILEAGAR
jgi:Family of unknown function (DUF6279)